MSAFTSWQDQGMNPSLYLKPMDQYIFSKHNFWMPKRLSVFSFSLDAWLWGHPGWMVKQLFKFSVKLSTVVIFLGILKHCLLWRNGKFVWNFKIVNAKSTEVTKSIWDVVTVNWLILESISLEKCCMFFWTRVYTW